MTVSWEVPMLSEGKYLSMREVVIDNLAPTQGEVAMSPVGNTAINLATTTTMEIPAGETRCYLIRYAFDLTVDPAFEVGWNLVSLPIEPLNAAVAEVLNDTAVARDGDIREESSRGVIHAGSVWAWESGAYVVATELHPLHGYWVYVTEAAVVLVQGTPAASSNLDLGKGWNLVGPPIRMPVPESTKLQGHCWYWKPDCCQYDIATELYPCIGYWLNSKSAVLLPCPQ